MNAQNHLRQQVQRDLHAQQWAAAEAGLRLLVEAEPDDADARLQLAELALRRGRLRDYTQQLLQAASALPENVPLLFQLVPRLFLAGETVAARTYLERLECLAGKSSSALAEQARLRWMLGDIHAAMALMQAAAADRLETPNEHYLHAMLLQYTGQIDRAESALLACLRRWPRFGDAAVALANLRTQKPEANHVDNLLELASRIPLDSASPDGRFARAGFESSLFKELDDLGRYDDAWQALARSNALMHSLTPYDQVGETAITDALIGLTESVGAKSTVASTAAEGPIPIFIVGLPRSGTTLLDRMLSSHSSVTSAGEIDDFRRQLRWMADVPAGGIAHMLEVFRRSATIDFSELGARYLAQTQWRAQGKRFYIDKLPINVRMVAFIRRALPHAPILHMVRDPMDVCFSNFKAMLGHSSPYSYDLRSLAHYYGEYARLVAHWHAAMPGAMLDVPYAALVRDKEATLRNVLSHCGLPWEDGCLRPERNRAPVATPSSSQVREPVYTRSLGEWRHYAAQLEPLQRMLAR